MAEPARHAWGHCLAVLRAAGPAEEAATLALRRGGRSLSTILAQARAAAVALADGPAPPPPPELDAPLDPDTDLVTLAVLLAGTRSPTERAVVDLDARLDRGRLGRALGLPPAQAASRVAAVAETWEHELDPALLAWLGPGECGALAELLGAQGPAGPAPVEDAPADADAAPAAADEAAVAASASLGALLALAGPVGEHVESCDVCSDRRRAMVSVRSLATQAPCPPVPQAVRVAAGRGWFRLPGPLPPPVDATLGRFSGPARLVAAVATVLVVAAAAVAVVAWRSHRPPRSPAAALASLPGSGNALTLVPAVVPADGIVILTNTSPRPLSWQASASAPWVEVDPSSGRLGPGEFVRLAIRASASAPPGGAHATVAVAGADGSAAAVAVTGPTGQALDLAASIQRCTVRAQVVDNVDAVVVLHWQVTPGAEHAANMSSAPGGYTATLPATATPLTWWVTASDSRGGRARTPDQPLAPVVCPGA